jgi:site-specific DNA recombinase
MTAHAPRSGGIGFEHEIELHSVLVANDRDIVALGAAIKLLLRARRFNATLAQGEDVPFAALAEREGVSRSYFTRLVRLSFLAPDITEAILDGRQPPDLTAEKLLEHSRLPLAWHDQRTLLGLA